MEKIRDWLFGGLMSRTTCSTQPRNELCQLFGWLMNFIQNEGLAPMTVEKNQNPGGRFGATC